MKENWEYKAFGEIASFRRGLTYSKGDVADDSSKKVLRSNNITLESNSLNLDDVACLRDDFSIPDEKMLHQGDIFICMSNGSTQHLGKVAYIDRDIDYAFGGFMGVIEPNRNNVCSKYVFYSCCSNSYRAFLNSIFNGANINNLKWSDLSKFKIPVPSLDEQEQVVAELDLLSGEIDKQKAQLKELDNLAQSTFYDMFGDPIENPKGWETRPLNEVAPQRPYEGTVPDVNGKYWLLNLDKVVSQSGDVLEKEMVDLNEIGNSVVAFDSTNVLYSKLRPYLNKVVIPNDFGYATSELVPLKPNRECLDRVFLTFLLRSKSFVNLISVRVAGAKMPRVSMDFLRNFEVILPPLDFQQTFADKIASIEKQKAALTQSIAETQKLLDYTMDKYFG